MSRLLSLLARVPICMHASHAQRAASLRCGNKLITAKIGHILHAFCLQDFMDRDRTFDVADTYTNTTSGERMVQNYLVCSASCLDGSGEPSDFSSRARNYTAIAYGFSLADFYLDR